MSAGFDVRLGLDNDPLAMDAYRVNHQHRGLLADVAEVNGRDLLDEAGLAEVDILIGSPACQGFSTHGRRNGWVRDDDPRNLLYRQYARLVGELKPSWFVLENVAGLLYFDRGSFYRRLTAEFEQHGYSVEGKLVLAADYGVPQLRRRLLVIGNRVGAAAPFPTQTHMGAYRRDTLALWDRRLSESPWLKPHATVHDAISDLPGLGTAGSASTYGSRSVSRLQVELRAGRRTLEDHDVTQLSDSHERLIRMVPSGGTWRDIPEHLLPERFSRIPRTNYTNLFARLSWDRPSYTITTQFNNVTTGCYTHPDEHRALSPREGARLQTFPDRFKFGTGNSRYRLIGNAVPPLLGRAAASALLREMDKGVVPIRKPSRDDLPDAKLEFGINEGWKKAI